MKHQHNTSRRLDNGNVASARQFNDRDNMNAYLYCRTSTDNPVALEGQKIGCVNLCKREGLVIAGIFTDANVPAFTIGPGLSVLIHTWQIAGRKVRHFVINPLPDVNWIIKTLNDALIAVAESELPTEVDAAKGKPTKGQN
jgi:hypothetical protein